MSNRLIKPPVWCLGGGLSGPENQNLRHLVRRSRSSLAAIDDSTPSLLPMVLPLGMGSLCIRHGLLSLSKRASERSEVDVYHYQMAVSKLCAEIGSINDNRHDMDFIHSLLASSLLLYIASLPQCDSTWVQHVRGMISIVRMTDQAALASSQLGRFLLSICAMHDIPAFSIGRNYTSQKAWLSWMYHRSSSGESDELTSLETTVGYPESLVNIIAQISELSEDNTHIAYHSGPPATWPVIPLPGKKPRRRRESQCKEKEERANVAEASSFEGPSPSDELETTLQQWKMPKAPHAMAPAAALALRTAWEVFRKALFLHLWRGYGFRANLLTPIRADRAVQAAELVDDIMTGIRAILQMSKSHRTAIGNAMLLPLAIVGCECTLDSGEPGAELLTLLDAIGQQYQLEHPKYLKEVFQTLWLAKKSMQAPESSVFVTQEYVSLESVAREMNLVISLL